MHICHLHLLLSDSDADSDAVVVAAAKKTDHKQIGQDYKEFTDAEGLLSLPTSDFHKPVCLEMRNITNGNAIAGNGGYGNYYETASLSGPPSGRMSPSYGLSTVTLPLETPLRLTAFTADGQLVHSLPSANMTLAQYQLQQQQLHQQQHQQHQHLPYQQQQQHQQLQQSNNYINGDLISVDSSDTYASCQTHPFVSDADLDQDFTDADGSASADAAADAAVAAISDADLNNLYINPLEKSGESTSALHHRATVKKSASGDTALRSLACEDISPMIEDGFQHQFQQQQQQLLLQRQQQQQQYQLQQQPLMPGGFDARPRGSRISLNESAIAMASATDSSALPKHRKTRFQQSGGVSVLATVTGITATTAAAALTRPRARFEVGQHPSLPQQHSADNLHESAVGQTNDSNGAKKKARSSFMPSRSLASATKLINQHLFGIQTASPRSTFFYHYNDTSVTSIVLFFHISHESDKVDKKLSLSIDSIDKSPNLESHRRSKSILKNKSDAAKAAAAANIDPESERLLADNLSGAGISDNSVSAIEIEEFYVVEHNNPSFSSHYKITGRHKQRLLTQQTASLAGQIRFAAAQSTASHSAATTFRTDRHDGCSCCRRGGQSKCQTAQVSNAPTAILDNLKQQCSSYCEPERKHQ